MQAMEGCYGRIGAVGGGVIPGCYLHGSVAAGQEEMGRWGVVREGELVRLDGLRDWCLCGGSWGNGYGDEGIVLIYLLLLF